MAFKVIFRMTTSDLKGIPEEARWAEEMGFDGLCADETNHDPFFPILLAAAATSKVTLQTRVALAFPRSPMVVAYAAIDLQNFSGGRFRLGLGTQVKGHIERRFSVKWDSPAPRMREYVQSLHAIWDNWQDGKDLDFQGRFYRFDLMTPYFSPGFCPAGRPPVYITGVNPYTCQVAGEVCDGLSFHVISSPEYISQVIKPNIAKGAEKAGRSPQDINVHGTGFVITGPDQKTVEAEREVVRNRPRLLLLHQDLPPRTGSPRLSRCRSPFARPLSAREMGRDDRADQRRNDRRLLRIRRLRGPGRPA